MPEEKTETCPLQKRLDAYINSAKPCPVAVTLICELRAHLRAAHKGAERNMNVAMIFCNKNDELRKVLTMEQPQ